MAMDIGKLELFEDWPLRKQTEEAWVKRVLADLPLFLSDHASNERKAAAIALEFVVRYRDQPSLISTAARIAQEEISHFRQVFERMRSLKLPPLPDEKCMYAKYMHRHARSRGKERLLDLLIINSLIEYRGMERFYLLSQAIEAEKGPEWREFYENLSLGEKGHGAVYLHEAGKIFSKEDIDHRVDALLDIEAEAMIRAPKEARLFS